MHDFRPDRKQLLIIVIYTEGALLLLGTIWCFVSKIQLAPFLVPRSMDFLFGLALAIALVITSFAIFGLAHLLEKVLNKKNTVILSMKDIALQELAPIFQNSGLMEIVLMALVSGFCEEIFFRGAVQMQFNLWIASFIFGMFHMPTLKFLFYGIWAMCAGILFGVAMESTHSLWTPITAHVLNNLLVILFFRYGPLGKKPADKSPT